MSCVLTIIEHDRGVIASGSLEALTAARALAESLSIPLVAAVCDSTDALAATCAGYGATEEPYALLIVFDGSAYLGEVPTPVILDNLSHAFRLLLSAKMNTTQAIERIKAEVVGCNEVDLLITFIESSKRGVIK